MARGFLKAILCWAVVGVGACSDDTAPPPDARTDGRRDLGTSDRPLPGDFRTEARADFYIPPDVGPQDGFNCKLTVESINKKPIAVVTQLSSLDDQDKTAPGIQLDVVASVIGKPDGTPITLQVTGLQPSPVVNSAGGEASFKAVTIAEGLTAITIRPEAAGCSANAVALSVQLDPSCTFVSPVNGAKLTIADDKLPGNGTFDYDVAIQTQNAAGGTVTLSIAGIASGTGTPNLAGTVSFPATAFSTGPAVEVKATVAVGFITRECSVTISIDTAAPACTLAFAPPATLTSKGIPGLGTAQDAEPATPKLQTTVTVDSVAGVDEIILDVDGVTQTATPDAVTHKATFKLTLDEGTRSLQATCKNKTAGSQGQSPKAQVLVDITPPPPVTDLACTVTNHRAGEITCTWKAPSDGTTGSGVEKFQVRYRTNSAVTAANFDATDTTKPADVAAVPAGATQTFKLTGLKMPNTYAEAVKAVDYLGNVSTVSNFPAGQKVDFKVQEILGQATASAFGYPIVLGDFNCDGYSDLAVGLNNAAGGLGEVQLFFATGAGIPASFSKKIVGTVANGFFGYGLVALQHDNDPAGCMDLAVLAPNQDGSRGKVYLYLGQPVWSDRDDSSTGKGAELVLQLSGAVTTERLARGMVAVDINGDGAVDLAMTHVDTSGTKWSNVLVLLGKTGIVKMGPGIAPVVVTLPAGANVVVVGGKSTDNFGTDGFGSCLGRGGFLDADQYEELLIGAPASSVAGALVGSAYVVAGAAVGTTQQTIDASSPTETRVHRIDGSSTNTYLGYTVGGVGDVDGDGTPEFLVADHRKTVGGNLLAGEVYLFDLTKKPKTVADAKAVITNDLPSTATNANSFGRAVATSAGINGKIGGDLDKDGFADLVIGMRAYGTTTSGAAPVFLGKSPFSPSSSVTTASYVLQPQTGGTITFSNPTLFAGDVNGDGYIDLAFGEFLFNSSTGRVVVYY